jgi:hypothetical protein
MRQRGSYHIIAWHSLVTHTTAKLDLLKPEQGSKAECT